MAPGALDPLTKEMMYLAVSVSNGCGYCIASHTAAALRAGMTEAMFGEVMAVTGMANETNRLANGYGVDRSGLRLLSRREKSAMPDAISSIPSRRPSSLSTCTAAISIRWRRAAVRALRGAVARSRAVSACAARADRVRRHRLARHAERWPTVLERDRQRSARTAAAISGTTWSAPAGGHSDLFELSDFINNQEAPQLVPVHRSLPAVR
jgi:AhpD family alkylhydroperoxidase